jgi:putative transposase
MHIGSITTAHPTGAAQQARNLALDPGERFGASGSSSVTADRTSPLPSTPSSRATGTTTILRTAAQAPRMNAICERLIGTLRRELLGRILILNQARLRAVLAGYQEHYSISSPRQGIGQRVPDGDSDPVTAADPCTWQIRRNRS